MGAALAVLITVFLAFSIDGLVIEGSSVEDMARDNPYLQTELRVSELYGDNTLVTLIVEAGAGTISNVLGDLEQIQGAFYAQFPDGEFRSILYMREQLSFHGLEDSDPIDRLLAVVSGQPKTSNLVSFDKKKFLVLLGVPKSFRDRDQLSGIYQQDLEHIRSVRPLSELNLRWDTEQSIERDLGVLVPSITLIILVIASIGFGSIAAGILLMAMLTISGILIISLFSLFSVSINLITLLAMPVVLILSLASAFHLLSSVSEYRQRSGNHEDMVEKTLERLFVPLSLSTVTTVVALATFGFSPIRPIAQLGLLTALALLLALVITLLLAPLGLRWFLRVSRQAYRPGIFIFLSAALRRNRKSVSIVLLTLMLGSSFSVPFLAIESNPDTFFPEKSSFVETYHEFEKEFGDYSVVSVLVAPPQGTWNPDENQAVFAVIRSMRDTLQTLDGIMRVDIDARTTIPDADTGHVMTRAYLLIVFVADKSKTTRLAQNMDTALEPFRALFNVGITNSLLVYDHFDRQATRSLLQALGVSFAVILCIFGFLFRSWRTMLAALAANAVPITVLCAVIWVFGMSMNILTSCVFLVALGVIVDDTIHILYYRSDGRVLAGSSIEYSVLMTTGAACCGFSLCFLSRFEGIQHFGAYCAIALALAVISDLTVLPCLLNKNQKPEN